MLLDWLWAMVWKVPTGCGSLGWLAVLLRKKAEIADWKFQHTFGNAGRFLFVLAQSC